MQLLFECRGRVIVTGMGKSGIICRKIAATLSSTGTSAFFLHPAEAIHGDLGAIREDDVVLALSHSGETEELVRLLEAIRRIGATADRDHRLSRDRRWRRRPTSRSTAASPKEACPMNLVPTASTTAALALGDALAMTLLVRKGFREEQFASLHPGGKLGRKLMTRRERHGRRRRRAARPARDACMPDVIHEMSSKRLGMTCVVDDDGRLAGVFTDGDLRRLMMTRPPNVLALTAGDVDDAETRSPCRATSSPSKRSGSWRRTRSRRSSSSTESRIVEGRRAPARSLAHADVLRDDVATPGVSGCSSSTSTAC